jgi:hypothetical protein
MLSKSEFVTPPGFVFWGDGCFFIKQELDKKRSFSCLVESNLCGSQCSSSQTEIFVQGATED